MLYQLSYKDYEVISTLITAIILILINTNEILITVIREMLFLLLRSTLGDRNPNLELDGLPVLYKPRNFEIFRSWTAVWTPLLFFAGAGLVFESGRPHGRILVGLVFMTVRGCCTWQVADIVTVLSCLCYNLNGRKLSGNTLSTQAPNVLSNLT